MTVREYRKVVGIGVITALLALAGSVQAYVHYYDAALPVFSRENLRAMTMASTLLISEVSFLYGDLTLMRTRSRGRRLVIGLTMVATALAMALTIGSEFSASLSEKKAQQGIELAVEFGAKRAELAQTRGERRRADESAKSLAQAVIKEVVAADARAYLANLLVALIAFVIYQFAEDGAKRRRVTPAGNVLPHNPALAAQVQRRIGLAPAEAKAYVVDNGYAIWANGEYKGFVRASDVRLEEPAEQPKSV